MRPVLDDPLTFELDRSRILERAAELGSELLRAWDAAGDLAAKANLAGREFTSVVLVGMGGSATAADYFAHLCQSSARIPVSVVRGYSVPNHVGPGSLVVVSSYSGNTEESLSCYDDARRRGAEILAVTTGGTLTDRARADGFAVWPIRYGSAPRAAIAHNLAPLLRLGTALGLIETVREDVEVAARHHGDFVTELAGAHLPTAQNPAKQLAEAIQGRTALILGAEHLAAVGVRFKNQLAENGKALAAADSIPEATHNLVVGLQTGPIAARALSVITLESALYDERTQSRWAATNQLIEEASLPLHRLQISAPSQLAEIVVGTAWGDFASIYLAFLNGEDPSPIPQIHRIKDHAALVADEAESPIDGSTARSHAAPITRGVLS